MHPISPQFASRALFAAGAILSLLVPSAASAADPIRIGSAPDISFRNEVQHAIDRGLVWLRTHQNSNGWWSTPDHPAVTALALASFLGEPSGRYLTNRPPELQSACAYIAASAQSDGSIHRGSLANYNTAISMMALALTGDRAYDDILRRGRGYLIGSQIDQGEAGRTDTPFDGGIGYGSHYEHSDMNNTLTALEALRATRYLTRDEGPGQSGDLNWTAAIQFLQNCQNLPGHNTQPWVSTKPEDLGGFVYYPGHSMAGGETNAESGRVALRSYGSVSYAGLLSYIYADLKPDDPRVAAVQKWLRENYTLEENPGMDQQGLYYYLHLMTKGLNAAGVQQLELKDGRRVDWRRDVAMRLLNLQQSDGSWVNSNNRWWEKDPNLVTAYSVMALEIVYRGL